MLESIMYFLSKLFPFGKLSLNDEVWVCIPGLKRYFKATVSSVKRNTFSAKMDSQDEELENHLMKVYRTM